MSDPLLDGHVDELLARIATPGHPACAGVATALTCAMAAALVRMAARSSVEGWEEAAGVAAQAHLLHGRASELVQASADTFAVAMGALRPVDGASVQGRLGPALEAAADVPLRVCRTAADVVLLAAYAAEHASEDVRADAVVAARLALAAAQGAAHLVSINLAVTGEDPRREEAEQAVRAARRVYDELSVR